MPVADDTRPRAVARSVTLKDIAEASGVSLSTVSRVLNKAPSRVPIPAETQERIEREAVRLGYRPNPFARALAGAPTMLLGAVVRDFRDPFMAAAVEQLATEAMSRGYNIVLGHIPGQGSEDPALPSVLDPRQADAVLLFGPMGDRPRLMSELREAPQPVVALWQGAIPLRFPTVDVDDRYGIRLGLEHLAELGHRRIAFASARLPGGNPAREEGYVEFMTERFDGVPDGYLQHCDSSMTGGAQAIEAILELDEVPTAVACSTDAVAVGVSHGAYNRGIEVPGQLSIVGFDDLMLGRFSNPALTTLRMPTDEIVAEGVRMALEYVRDPAASAHPSLKVFEPTLILRASTGPPRSGGLPSSAGASSH
jgi:DNA-binding LacI/PurR family transcriptional regulator